MENQTELKWHYMPKSVIIIFLALVIIISSCGDKSKDSNMSNSNSEGLVDNKDTAMLTPEYEEEIEELDTLVNKIISEVKIGKQTWMTENLNVKKFCNGDPILKAKNAEEFQLANKNKQPAWCYYENKTANGKKYGKLYNEYAVYDPRGLAPKGYHIPDEEEWVKLIDYLGGKWIAGSKMKTKIDWYKNNNADNSSGFSGLPGGYINNEMRFIEIGKGGFWWSVHNGPHIGPSAWPRRLNYYTDKIDKVFNCSDYGFSVRCIKD